MTGIREGALPDRILDVLETDGGWMTTSAIYDLGLASRNSTRKALFRLRDLHSAIESRYRSENGRGVGVEDEWRAL